LKSPTATAWGPDPTAVVVGPRKETGGGVVAHAPAANTVKQKHVKKLNKPVRLLLVLMHHLIENLVSSLLGVHSQQKRPSRPHLSVGNDGL
jgi:hypothetical protein